MVGVTLQDGNKQSLHTAKEVIAGGEPVLVIETIPSIHGVHKAVTRESAGTTIVATPLNAGSLQVTAFLLSCRKGASQTTTVRWSDGTNTEDLIIQEMDVAITVPMNLADTRTRGWRDAHIDLITSGAADASLTLWYVKHVDAITYAEWVNEQ